MNNLHHKWERFLGYNYVRRARCREVYIMLPIYYTKMAEIHFMCAYVYQ